ncbi:hypothetical protein HGRIS_009894 [Hohenbuehelia grisea]|uniref:ACB domain-containing protein n=1 Tax=Hohenbuehelia grisea TaxID=104357 RepID=A0ABR3J2J0_9AGAR
MDSHELIDAQFDRAVEIVQALPKTGPIQTDYEEKLTMYSLYKQATVGNVKGARPAMWDMLARAKWDAWAKHKDLEPYQAKWLYVDALLKVLRKYSDKTVARDLVRELESYGGDPSNLVLSSTMSRSEGSDSSGSTVSDDDASPSSYQHEHTTGQHFSHYSHAESSDPDRAEEQEHESDPEEQPAPMMPERAMSQSNRPQSSLSSRRYRTPLAGSVALSASTHGIPAAQPLPGFETPSAFAEPSHASAPSTAYPTTSSYVGHFSDSSRAGYTSPHQAPSYPAYRAQAGSVPIRPYGLPLHGAPLRPSSTRPPLEVAVESVQAHLAALSERLDSLESFSMHPSRSNVSLSSRAVGSPGWAHGRGSPTDRRERLDWDINDLGMWSVVLNPVSYGIGQLKEFAKFFARNENRSPTVLIIRRLCLDVSFLLCVLALVRSVWRKSGVRRGEVRSALQILWQAIVGTKKTRTMIDRGV